MAAKSFQFINEKIGQIFIFSGCGESPQMIANYSVLANALANQRGLRPLRDDFVFRIGFTGSIQDCGLFCTVRLMATMNQMIVPKIAKRQTGSSANEGPWPSCAEFMMVH